MHIISTLIGIIVIAIMISTLYIIGRITIPYIDPDVRREPAHFIVVMLAGVLGIAVGCMIAMVFLFGWYMGEGIMQFLT